MLLRTGAAGFCHTDELIRTGGMPVSLKHDLIGGHEPAGTVVDLGEDAVKAGWYIGQRVGALGYMGYCGMYYAATNSQRPVSIAHKICDFIL